MKTTSQDTAILAEIKAREITEILHFTTNRGLRGIFALREVLCRDRLAAEDYLEYILTLNCATRAGDADWTGYVNMSISRINDHMFGYSTRWHLNDEDLWWVVLSFEPSILANPGVWFTTTNNIYRDVIKRSPGIEGLRAMFADEVPWGYRGSVKRRYPGMPASWTTDPQAEVLYPRGVALDRLQAIYVRKSEHIDEVRSLQAALEVPSVPVTHRPAVFR